MTSSEGKEFDRKTNAVPPSLIDFALADMMTYDELFSTPSAQKAQGDDDNDNDDDSAPLGATGEYEVISAMGELLERETRRRRRLFLCIILKR